MKVKRIYSGSEFEPKVGYCRAIVAGGWVHIAGTVGQGKTVQDQCSAALATIETALKEAGCSFEDVVRVRYMLPNAQDFEPCWSLLRAVFRANPPVATMIECGLVDPAYKIEIEVTALVPDQAEN